MNIQDISTVVLERIGELLDSALKAIVGKKNRIGF